MKLATLINLFAVIFLSSPASAIEWPCHAWVLGWFVKPIPVVSQAQNTEDPQWDSLGALLNEDTGRQIPILRLRSARTPVRRTIQEWVGWKPGTVKFYVAIQENLRLIEETPYERPARLRRFRNTVMRLGNLLGLQPSLYNYHWSLYVVGADGYVRGIESPGPLRRAEPRHGLSNRNSILMPVTFASIDKEQEALREFEQFRKGEDRTLGCGHSVCRILGADAGQRSLSLCANFRRLVDGEYVQVDRVLVLGTQIGSGPQIERSALYTDLGYITPIVARPVILVSQFATLLWLLFG
jgi:hypothetical protein